MNDKPGPKDRRSAGGDDRKKPAGAERRSGAREERPEWQSRVAQPIREDAPKSPMIPDEITDQDLELGIRVQLKTLTAENAEWTARHLAMVSLLHEQDPELAHLHALAAARRAGRIAIVRETLGITAYQVGDYGLAIRELTTYRRLSGSNDQLPVMVDCERGLGRPQKALELGRSVDRNTLQPSVRVNLAIAMSGARLDLNETDLALAELEIPELDPTKVFEFSTNLFRAYANTLIIGNRESEAKRWSELADRAEAHFIGNNNPENEVFSVIEEIQIPEVSRSARPSKSQHDAAARTPRDPSRGPRSKTDDSGSEERPKRPPFTGGQRNSGPPPRGGFKPGGGKGFGGPPKGRSRGPGRGR
jgi:23S rRNA pseudouridine2605 synthase